MIENRYAGFVGTSPDSHFEFDTDLYAHRNPLPLRMIWR
jgi:hypothetical protein